MVSEQTAPTLCAPPKFLPRPVPSALPSALPPLPRGLADACLARVYATDTLCLNNALPFPLRRLADAGQARVYATDSILTTLMCVRSAIYSWDILITKRDGKLFFDKRDSSSLNLLTVNETAPVRGGA